MSGLSISKKIMSGVFFILIICIGVAVFAGINMTKLRNIVTFFRGNNSIILVNAYHMSSDIHSATSYFKEIIQTGSNDELIDNYKASIDNARNRSENINKAFNDPVLKKVNSVRKF